MAICLECTYVEMLQQSYLHKHVVHTKAGEEEDHRLTNIPKYG